jgi:hypothetical protein
VVGEAVDTAFGELLAALLARVLISVGGIFELGSAVKVLKDYGVGLATHGKALTQVLRRNGALDARV